MFSLLRALCDCAAQHRHATNLHEFRQYWEALRRGETYVIEVTNTSAENILLDLDSGPLRLDAGRALRLTANALEQPQLTALINTGKVKESHEATKAKFARSLQRKAQGK